MSGVWEPCTTQLADGTQCGLNRDHTGDCYNPMAAVREALLQADEARAESATAQLQAERDAAVARAEAAEAREAVLLEALEGCASALENEVIVLKDDSLHMHSCQRYQLGVARCELSCEEAQASIAAARAALADPSPAVEKLLADVQRLAAIREEAEHWTGSSAFAEVRRILDGEGQ